MRLTRIRFSVPSLITTIFVLAVLLAFIVDTRDRARRKSALVAAQAAYHQARIDREVAEQTEAKMRREKAEYEPAFRKIQREVEHTLADEQIKKADYYRLRGLPTERPR